MSKKRLFANLYYVRTGSNYNLTVPVMRTAAGSLSTALIADPSDGKIISYDLGKLSQPFLVTTRTARSPDGELYAHAENARRQRRIQALRHKLTRALADRYSIDVNSGPTAHGEQFELVIEKRQPRAFEPGTIPVEKTK